MAGGDLPKPREPRSNVKPPKMLKVITLEIIFRMRTRTNNAHVPFKDIKELGQFINAVLAKETSKAGNARIVRNLEGCAIALVHVHQAVFARISISHHGTKFVTA